MTQKHNNAQAPSPHAPPRVNIVISETLHRKAKILAVYQGRSVREVMDEAVSEWLKRHEKNVREVTR